MKKQFQIQAKPNIALLGIGVPQNNVFQEYLFRSFVVLFFFVRNEDGKKTDTKNKKKNFEPFFEMRSLRRRVDKISGLLHLSKPWAF